jgi:hypothetical protein
MTTLKTIKINDGINCPENRALPLANVQAL